MAHIMKINDFINEMKSNEANDNTIEIISFTGFYDTLWGDYQEDELIDVNRFEEVMGHAPQYLSEWGIDWDAYKKALGEFYVGKIQDYYRETFGNTFSLQYDSIFMPKDYSRSKDIMYAKLITPNKKAFIDSLIAKMLECRESDGLEEIIKRNHSSRVGFVSLMSTSFDEWIKEVRNFNLQYIGYAMYYTQNADGLGARFDQWDRMDEVIYEEALEDNITAVDFARPETEEAKREYEEYLDKM